MKNKSKLLTLLCVPFMLLGCSEEGGNGTNNPGENTNPGTNEDDDTNKEHQDDNVEHTHSWVEDAWESDKTGHWHKCSDATCKEKKDQANHTFGEWVIDSYAIDETREVQNQWGWGTTVETYKKNGSKHRICSVCNFKETDIVDYYKPEPTSYTSIFNREGYTIFDKAPEIKFTVTEDPKGGTSTNFATKPNKSKGGGEAWEVTGKFTTSNCGIDYDIGEVTGGMKVRGNYTTDYAKKGFRIKFDKKQNLFGLNGGKKFKKWVLFADVKDSSMLRNAVSFFMGREMTGDNVFVTDCTPVHLYINNQYWGLYLLAEQKEAKDGRVDIPELPSDTYSGTDIGYSFELDKYAPEEAKKGEDGDPTFTVQYKPNDDKTRNKWENSNECQNKQINTYTMLSDIGDRSTQIPFIKNRVEQLHEILYRAANNTGLKEIDASGQLVTSSETDVEKCLEKSFDIQSFVDMYILNEITCNPDVGYSSFYLTYDNSASGDKKLRLDNPWDFDSALGLVNYTMMDSKGMFASTSSNMWLRLMYKCNFFQQKVKARWNELREAKLFERALDMIEDYSISYKNEYKRNFDKWTSNMGDNPETTFELRNEAKALKTERQAEQLLYNWLVARVDYLETVFGNKRATVDLYGGRTDGTGAETNQETNPTTEVDYTEFKSNATKVRLEAESGTRQGNCIEKSKDGEGISGNKYVGELNPNGGSVTFNYTASKASEALLTVGLSARTGRDYNLTELFDITVNGTSFSSNCVVSKGNGTDFHCWTSVDAGKINLKSGANSIVFTAKQESTNFDYIDLYIAK